MIFDAPLGLVVPQSFLLRSDEVLACPHDSR
jgi:hypothetical protein